MEYEQIIKNITIIEGFLFLFAVIILIIILFVKYSFKNKVNTTFDNVTNKKDLDKNVLSKEEKRLTTLAHENDTKLQQNEIKSIPGSEISSQLPMENKRRNKIIDSLQEEEMLNQKVLEKFMQAYSTEGRESIKKSKMIVEEELKMYKKEQIQKVREGLNIKDGNSDKFGFKPDTAMVIDDNQFSKNILKKILKEISIEVLDEIDSGVEAIELAERLKPEFIFLDIKMSDIDGLTATKLIILKLPKTKIIVCSNHCDNNILASLEELNVKGFIQKPFSKENIVEVIKEIKKSEK